MSLRRCAKCGELTAEAFFKSSGTICEDCWHVHDMARFLEAPAPEKGEKPDAKMMRLANGKLAIICPHCQWRTLRSDSYFVHDPQTTRCNRCMAHFVVKTSEAE